MAERRLVLRADKLAFAGISATQGGALTYHRMRGFKNLPTSKNPVEYSRAYVDEYGEITDVVGMSESKEFEFDQYINDPVHEYLVRIFDEERLGADAQITIVTINRNAPSGENNAVSRVYSVVPDTEGDGTEAYTFTGRFVALTPPEVGEFTISEDGLTATEVTAG